MVVTLAVLGAFGARTPLSSPPVLTHCRPAPLRAARFCRSYSCKGTPREQGALSLLRAPSSGIPALLRASRSPHSPCSRRPRASPATAAQGGGIGPPPADAEATQSGLASTVLREGGAGGERPGPLDVVVVHYTGWTLSDGEQFDTTEGEEPCNFEARAVMPGWTEALQLMVPGEKRRFWIPSQLAYGNAPPPAPQGDLVFDIELLSFERAKLKPKMGGFKLGEPKGAKEFKSPWAFLDKLIP